MNFLNWFKKERAIRRADKLAKRGNTRGALALIEEALAMIPNNVDLKMQKAWAQADLKQYDLAKATVDDALKDDPQNAVLHLIRGEAEYGSRQYEQAKETLHKALELSGENLRIEYSLGLTYVALGQIDRAAQYFESSIRYDKSLVQSRLLAMAEHYLLQQRLK